MQSKADARKPRENASQKFKKHEQCSTTIITTILSLTFSPELGKRPNEEIMKARNKSYRLENAS